MLIWENDGITRTGEDVGGDRQVSDPYSSRYWRRADEGWVVIDVYGFAAQDNPEEGSDFESAVQIHTTYCTDLDDVGGTETSGDVTYESVGGWYASAESALTVAQHWMANSFDPEDYV